MINIGPQALMERNITPAERPIVTQALKVATLYTEPGRGHVSEHVISGG
jgi:hypothetical protein